MFELPEYKVYIKIDNNNQIININSSAYLKDAVSALGVKIHAEDGKVDLHAASVGTGYRVNASGLGGGDRLGVEALVL